MPDLLIPRLKYYLATRAVPITTWSLAIFGICSLLLLTNVASPALAISPAADDQDAIEQPSHRAGLEQETSVTITNDTDAYEEEQTVEGNSAYPIHNSTPPTITLTADAQDATINRIEVVITYTAVEQQDTSNRLYQEEKVVLSKVVNDNERMVEATLDIREVLDRKQSLEEEFGNGVVVTPRLESTVTYQYETSAGQMRAGTISVTGEITRVGNLYRLPSGTDQARHTIGGNSNSSGSQLLDVLFIGGVISSGVLIGITYVAERRIDTKVLAREIQTARFSDWITEINSYTPKGQPTVVEVNSMEGLVNLAIDTQERVLHISVLDEYIVLDQDTMYKYQPDMREGSGETEFFGLGDAGPIPKILDKDAPAPTFEDNENFEVDVSENPSTQETNTEQQKSEEPPGDNTTDDGDSGTGTDK